MSSDFVVQTAANCDDSSGSGGNIISSDDCSDAIQDLGNCANVVVRTCT